MLEGIRRLHAMVDVFNEQRGNYERLSMGCWKDLALRTNSEFCNMGCETGRKLCDHEKMT